MSTPTSTAPPPLDGAPLPVTPQTVSSADRDDRPRGSVADTCRSDWTRGPKSPSIAPPTTWRPRQDCPSHRPDGWASKSRTRAIAP